MSKEVVQCGATAWLTCHPGAATAQLLCLLRERLSALAGSPAPPGGEVGSQDAQPLPRPRHCLVRASNPQSHSFRCLDLPGARNVLVCSQAGARMDHRVHGPDEQQILTESSSGKCRQTGQVRLGPDVCATVASTGQFSLELLAACLEFALTFRPKSMKTDGCFSSMFSSRSRMH